MTREEAKEFIAQSVKSDVDMAKVADAIKALEQEQKIGHWIYEKRKRLINETDEGAEYITDYWCKCSNCGSDFGYIKMKDVFCKYCGARMIKLQERNDEG